MSKPGKGILIGLIVSLALALGAAVVVIAAAVSVFLLADRGPTLAADGGVEVVGRTDPAARDAVIEIVRQRLDELDLDGAPVVAADGDDGVVVQVPGAVDGDLLAKALTMRGQLTFCGVSTAADTFDLTARAERWAEEQAAAGSPSDDAAVDAWLADQLHGDVDALWSYEVDAQTGKRSRELVYVVHRHAPVDGTMVREAVVDHDVFGIPYVALTFDDTGRDAFCQLSDDFTGSPIAIVLDGEVLSAPVVMEPICGGQARITMGNGAPDVVLQEALLLAGSLRAGALPADVELESLRVVGPAE